MKDHNHMNVHVADSYNRTAAAYAKKFSNELDHKHFDRMLLRAFAVENSNCKNLLDLGCGPGQTTYFLHECGINDILGIDISEAMIAEAKKHYPQLPFDVADMLNLKYANDSFDAAIAFYAIVNFNYQQVQLSFKEVKRVLKPGSQFLFSFHLGDSVVHLDNFLDTEVNLDFYFFDKDEIRTMLERCGFTIIDVMERQPYKQVEYESQRAYIWARTGD